jgi:hypothetical protein
MTQFRAKTPTEIAQYLLSHGQEVTATFWLGAGASRSADIPDAETLANQILDKFVYLPRDSWSEKSEVTKFAHFFSILSPVSRRMFLHEILSKVNNPNAAHLLLARMIREGWANTALTSNFDNLLPRAMRLVGLLNPWIVDVQRQGETVPDSLTTGSVVYFNGAEDNHRTCSAYADIKRVEGSIRQAIFRAAQDSVVIVLGYSGYKDPLIDILAEVPHFAHGLFWVTKDSEPTDHVKEKILRPNLYSEFLGGWDADRFMQELVVSGLGLSDPGTSISAPPLPTPPPAPSRPPKVKAVESKAPEKSETLDEAEEEDRGLLDDVQELVADIDEAIENEEKTPAGPEAVSNIADDYGADDDDDDDEFVVRKAPGDEADTDLDDEIIIESEDEQEVQFESDAAEQSTPSAQPETPDFDIFAEIDESIFELGKELDIDLDADEEELIRKLGLNGHSLDISHIDDEPEIPVEVEVEMEVEEPAKEDSAPPEEIIQEPAKSEAPATTISEAPATTEEPSAQKADAVEEPQTEAEEKDKAETSPDSQEKDQASAEEEKVEIAESDETPTESKTQKEGSVDIAEIIDKAHEALVIGGSEELIALAQSALDQGAPKAFPALTEALLDWGDEQFSEGFFSKARQAAEKARLLSPEDPVVYARLRDIAMKMGDEDYAAEMAENASKLQKKSQS